MALLDCPQSYLDLYPDLETLAKLIADSLSETKVYVKSSGPSVFGLYFEDNTAYINIGYIAHLKESNKYSFTLELFVDKKSVWHKVFAGDGIDIGSFAQVMYREYKDGFIHSDGSVHHWQDTACEPGSIEDRFVDVFAANNEKDIFPGILVDCNAELMANEPSLVLLAKGVACGVAEAKVYIRQKGVRSYYLYFNDNTSYFIIHNPRKSKTGYYGCTIEFIYKGQTVWKYANDLIVIWEFQDIISRRYNNGFPRDAKGVHKSWWQVTKCEEIDPDSYFFTTGAVDYDSSKLVIDCPAELEQECKYIKSIASCIALNLKESKATVRRSRSNVNYWYVISFDDNTSWFQVRWRGVSADNQLKFDVRLVSNGGTIWHKNHRGIEFMDFADEMYDCGESGFFRDDNPNETFEWETTHCEPNDIAVTPYCDIAIPKYEDDGGHKNIVPDGITQIRIVSLKYEGKVIAFRFKTDKGSFDMDKSAAAQYGISGIKVDKFITLQNVNGLLMSESEKSGKSVIPDVSESEVDCLKLMNALLGEEGS